MSNKTTISDSFADRVYAVIAAIPRGKVATYGQVARLAGMPTYVRQVCFILRHVPPESTLPCYRIINSQGKISPNNKNDIHQKTLLIEEGIVFGENDKVDLKTFGWHL